MSLYVFDDSQMPYDLKKYNIGMRNVPSFNGFAKPLFFTACECMCSSCQAVLLWSTMVCDLQNYSDLKLVRTSLCFKILPMSCRCHFVFPLFSFIFEKKCYFMCQISFELFWSLCSNLLEAAFFFRERNVTPS